MHDVKTFDLANYNETREALPSEASLKCTITDHSVEFFTTLTSSIGSYIFEYRASFEDHEDWRKTSNFVTV